MTQLCLKMGQRMRVTLETRMNHVRMRKSGVHRVYFCHVRQTNARVQTSVDSTRRGIVVVLPLTIVVPGCQFRSGGRRLSRFRRRRRCLTVRVLPAHVLRVRQLVIFLPLHAPVLEPDLNLPLGQHQGMSDLDPSPSRQVPIVMEFLLQLEDLVPRVRGPLSLRLHPWLVRAVRCKNQTETSSGVSWLASRDQNLVEFIKIVWLNMVVFKETENITRN